MRMLSRLAPSRAAGIAAFVVIILTASVLVTGCASTGGGASYPILATTLEDELYDIGTHLNNGETVALVFWQTGSERCKEEAPRLAAAARENGENITFLGIVPGPARVIPADRILEKANAWGLSYPTLRDPDLALYNLFGVTGTPTIIVIGPDRELRYKSSTVPGNWAALSR